MNNKPMVVIEPDITFSVGISGNYFIYPENYAGEPVIHATQGKITIQNATIIPNIASNTDLLKIVLKNLTVRIKCRLRKVVGLSK